MFLCRERELQILNRRYHSDRCECVIIYGRRRVGKTALITEFIKDKKAILFPALRATAKDNREALSKAIAACRNPGIASAPVYQSFDDAFAEITRMAREERVIFVIDELPFLCEADHSIQSRLQHLLDHDWKNSRLFLILCGSSMSFMEKEILSDQSPLFGRRTAQLKLLPLSYRDTARFHPELSPEDNALIYGITGGIPHYINLLNVKGTVREALLENFFDPSAYLFEEPENLLRQEVREPAVYNSIITAIADGASKSNEIASRVHLESSACSKYLKVLIELGIVQKLEPVMNSAKNKVIYRIVDPFFRFWYRYVPANMLAITAGQMDRVFDQSVGDDLSNYMGQIFEVMCHTWLIEHADHLPFLLGNIGEWWGNHPKEKKEIQIDIVGIETKSYNRIGGKRFLIGSCKYKNVPVGMDELELIEDYASVITSSKDQCYYYIFSKGGFSEGLRSLASEGAVKLFTLDELYESPTPRFAT